MPRYDRLILGESFTSYTQYNGTFFFPFIEYKFDYVFFVLTKFVLILNFYTIDFFFKSFRFVRWKEYSTLGWKNKRKSNYWPKNKLFIKQKKTNLFYCFIHSFYFCIRLNRIKNLTPDIAIIKKINSNTLLLLLSNMEKNLRYHKTIN